METLGLGAPELLFILPMMLLGLLPYVLGIWAIVMLVQLTRANREISARLAALETWLKQRP
jgi:hypothetical protein